MSGLLGTLDRIKVVIDWVAYRKTEVLSEEESQSWAIFRTWLIIVLGMNINAKLICDFKSATPLNDNTQSQNLST